MNWREFEEVWLAHFAEGVPKRQLEAHVTSRGNCLWHLFSWELLPEGSYLEGDDARAAYNRLGHGEREQAYFIEPFGKEQETFSMPWQESGAYHLEERTEIFVAAKDFSWTYVKTHEGDHCGPYFYRKKK